MTNTALLLPALRGTFGDWIYYSCLIPIRELGTRVSYARELQSSPELSKLIQRALEDSRASQIANYLASTQERFFNSLVIATYKGDPQWFEVGNFHSKKHQLLIEQIPEGLADTMGFLQLTGKEKIFAIDGQHRLAGIKRALNENTPLNDDFVPVLIVGHKTTQIGVRRTRRLFTTLNKTAVPVKKRDIIALDEDDVMAITARALVETDPKFSSPKIAVIGNNSLPPNSDGSLTIISNLYDVLKRIFMFQLGIKRDTKLRFNRPSDDELAKHMTFAQDYFESLGRNYPPVRELMRSKSPKKITPKYRNADGGHILFRPMGLEMWTRLAIEYATQKKVDLSDALAALSALPTDLAESPFRDTIWIPVRRAMEPKGRDIALDLCRHMLGLSIKKGGLLGRYRKFVDDDERQLPEKIS